MQRKPAYFFLQAAVLCLWASFLLFGGASAAFAHSELERTAPEPNTKYEQSPRLVELGFNEAIEAKVGSVEVLDDKSRRVTDAKPQTSADHKSISLALPELGEGVYTVSYAIISADGHPVSGSYVFVVGNPPEAVDASAFDPHKELGHEGHGASTQLTTNQFIIYAVRSLYYAALLWTAGLMLWPLLTRGRGVILPGILKKWEPIALRTLLVAVLVYIFAHAREILKGYPSGDYDKLFLETTVGKEWIALLALSLAGFLFVRMHPIARAIWAAAILAVESWSGHAAVFSPKSASVLFDFVHLAAGAVWAGGLMLLLALWQKDRKEAGRFAALFSRAALLSLVLLTLSGVGMTLLFLPSLKYLFYTSWGTLLLIKTGLVVLVLGVGGALHMKIRKGGLPVPALLRVDASLMALIIVVAALFTYISPLPANSPVTYHQMGDKLHVSLRVTPNKAGINEITLKVWLPDAVGAAKAVQVRLFSQDRKELGPIEVPLQTYEDTELTDFDGFVKSAYKAEGPFIPFAGRWQAEIRVRDKDDNETVQKVDFRNY
ncbi:copper resistance protein CopC [Paenibacillus sacheonensis]|uniref:Copper resistance protein CopC n=1 Tax=Paenibacillus sacheonensis TaxID=742054 RepID=A0A7X5C0E6_9BACL|nr:copper resistance protein CopC [Paenibacillus sacheonensis]MBM7566800.1 copper transport protein [Paenibacillus sacheonensis]NBC71627.1 copper resistance protein CopC [Paenibacillus sacheonensis]